MTPPGDLSLDDNFVAKMDQIYTNNKELDGNETIRRAIKFDRRLTSFCRVRFHKAHSLALDGDRKSSVYFYSSNFIFIACATVICINLYYHYRHEFYLLQYYEFNQTRQDFSASHADRIDAYLTYRIEATGQELRASGAPQMSMVQRYPFAVICFELIILVYGFYNYMFLALYFHLVEPIEKLYFFRVIEDPRREQHMTHLLIKNQVNRVLESNRNHTRRLIQNSRLILAGQRRICNQMTRIHLATYEHDAKTLQAMCLRGQLNPISRSPRWIDKLALLYCVLAYYVYLLNFATGPLIILLYVSVDFLGSIVLCLQLVYCTMLILSGTHYLTMMVINVLDQIRSVIDINTKVNRCIQDNEIFLTEVLNKTQPEQTTQFNERLLLVLMEYKICKSMLAEVYPIMSHLTSFSYLVVSVAPIVGKIHLVYMRIPAIRLYILGLSVMVMLFGDLFVIPTCVLQSRWLSLQKSLAYLQAHVVWAANLERDNTPGRYNQHTVWMLRSEYMNEDHLASNLFSYARALRLHFWFGIVALSLLFEESNSSRGLVAGIFSDPLGLKRLQYDFLA